MTKNTVYRVKSMQAFLSLEDFIGKSLYECASGLHINHWQKPRLKKQLEEKLKEDGHIDIAITDDDYKEGQARFIFLDKNHNRENIVEVPEIDPWDNHDFPEFDHYSCAKALVNFHKKYGI